MSVCLSVRLSVGDLTQNVLHTFEQTFFPISVWFLMMCLRFGEHWLIGRGRYFVKIGQIWEPKRFFANISSNLNAIVVIFGGQTQLNSRFDRLSMSLQ